jgi:hypothetical protein
VNYRTSKKQLHYWTKKLWLLKKNLETLRTGVGQLNVLSSLSHIMLLTMIDGKFCNVILCLLCMWYCNNTWIMINHVDEIFKSKSDYRFSARYTLRELVFLTHMVWNKNVNNTFQNCWNYQLSSNLVCVASIGKD